MKNKEYYISKLNLKPLITKDFLGEFYISENGHCSWAFFLLPEDCVFPFHKMRSDSSWHYCAGGPLELMVIDTDNKLHRHLIGNDLDNQKLVHITKPFEWFGARSLKNSQFTLVTHCIAPPYDANYDDFGYYEQIVQLIPEHEEVAKEFCAYAGINDKYILDPQVGYR